MQYILTEEELDKLQNGKVEPHEIANSTILKNLIESIAAIKIQQAHDPFMYKSNVIIMLRHEDLTAETKGMLSAAGKITIP